MKFSAECKLFKLVKLEASAAARAGVVKDGDSLPKDGELKEGDVAEGGWRWQEKGAGILHVNKHAKTGDGRMVMRMKGVLKLLLNTPVLPSTKYEKVGQKSVRFVGVDVDASSGTIGGKDSSLSAYRLNLLSGDQQGKFVSLLRDEFEISTSS